MDKLEYEQWKNCCDSLQNDLEEIKTENVEVSIQDCAALSTEASVKGEVSQTWKDESQDEKGQTDKIQSLPELRELRQNLTRLLRSHVPTLELEQVINKVFAQVLDAITPKVASLLTKETKLPDADLFLEYKEYKEEDNQSIPPEYLHTRHTSAITDIFVPELINHTANSGEYRFLCSHAGQFHCKLTKIVFEMKGKGEVLYTVESWDNSQLQGMGQFQPAGPLYNIKCSEDSVHYMHFPHCEIYDGTNLIDLAVAHFSEGNVEIIQPLKITNTHVIFEVHGLSIFGLLKKIFWDTPISAQVLLFYKEMIGIQRRKKLHIHLLPGNVAVEEVQKRHQSSTYIPCSSTCQLIPGKKYRPLCEPYASQPKAETFGYDYGPNYHPTFEVIFNTEVEDLALGLLDEIGLEVWEPRQVLLTDEMREGAQDQIDNDVKFVDLHRDMLIQRVSSVNEIADNLLTKRMISNETYSDIGNATTSQEKMRILYRSLNSGGRAVKAEFYKVLMEKEPYLVDDLLPTSTDA
ncbi:uncharacterized protein LOC124382901 isoform X3 [Silurus meridionalis]|nr:uncharacterized protein LOC124382901 isoform X3 [Silurus meridionalis]